VLPTEPLPTALALTIFGALLALSAILGRTLGRMGVPVVIVFLVLGMAAGSEGIGGIYFEDYHLAFRVGTVALALILFDGGMNTSADILRRNTAPAALLATVGVLVTAALVAAVARLLGFGWREAFLLGAIVSSTDAAAVFSILRSSGISLKKRVGATLELESGLNDPMAVILTLALAQSFVAPDVLGPRLAIQVAMQLGVGAVLGVAVGYAGRLLLRWIEPVAGGFVPVLTLSVAFVAFGVPTLLSGSGFLAVYIAGLILGNGPLPYRPGLLRVHDFIAWFSQVVMFLALGLLVFPSQLPGVAMTGLAVAAFLALVGRPLAVWLCLAPFRYPAREVVFVGWVGLRGAVPIVLATYPVLAGIEAGMVIFNVVFFVVVVSAVVQGSSVPWVTRRLRLSSKAPPPPPAVLEITSTKLLRGEVVSFYIHPKLAVCGATIGEIPFPPESRLMLVVRGPDLVAPRGSTQLAAGDHVTLFCRPEDRPLLRLLFGQEEQEQD
jgi:potassium/hydrogen antiporter